MRLEIRIREIAYGDTMIEHNLDYNSVKDINSLREILQHITCLFHDDLKVELNQVPKMGCHPFDIHQNLALKNDLE